MPAACLFRVIVVGYIDSVNAGIRTRFLNVPDAPVSRFELTLKGGKKGLIQNSANLCAGKRHVNQKLTGQNGRTYNTKPVMKVDCKAKKQKRRR